MVDRPDLSKYQPGCNLAHDLVNKLSVIVGSCDLIKDAAELDPQHLQKLLLIRDIAVRMANELNLHQCEIEVAKRPPVAINSALPSAKPA